MRLSSTSFKARRRSRRGGLIGASAGSGTPLRGGRRKPKSNIKVAIPAFFRFRAVSKLILRYICVRVRPRNQVESNHADARNVVRLLDETVLVFDPHEQQTPSYFKGRAIRDPTVRRNRDLKFAYDSIFDSDASNADVYERTTKTILDKLLEGINCSVFAYGATGAGKTFTMVGNGSHPGVIARTVLDLYERIESMADDVTCDVQVSYLEIYNEQVRDLFQPDNGTLNIRDDGVQGITVANLSYHTPTTADHLMSMLEEGNRNRTQHPTDANAESSRSHAVFQVVLSQRPRTADVSSDVLVSKMSLIDLAGSERATATTNCGERFREGANINRSLLSLGNCINALAQGKRGAHIPYRDSKLTRILKDSLGGNCQTVMIANVSPSSLSYEDTYNTLKYADRAKHIKTDLKKNIHKVDHPVHEYSPIVQELRAEVAELKGKYHTSESENQTLRHRVESLELQVKNQKCDPVFGRMLVSVFPLLQNYTQLQEQYYLHKETQHRLEQQKLDIRCLVQKRLEGVNCSHTTSFVERRATLHERWCDGTIVQAKDTDKTARHRARCIAAQEHLKTKLEQLEQSLAASQTQIHSAMASVLSGNSSETVETILVLLNGQSQLVQLKNQAQLFENMLAENKALVEHDSTLVHHLMSLAIEQHLVLSGHDHLTNKLRDELESVLRLVRCPKEVAWRDETEPRPKELSLTDRCLRLEKKHTVIRDSPERQQPTAPKSVRKSLFAEQFKLDPEIAGTDDETYVLKPNTNKENIAPVTSPSLVPSSSPAEVVPQLDTRIASSAAVDNVTTRKLSPTPQPQPVKKKYRSPPPPPTRSPSPERRPGLSPRVDLSNKPTTRIPSPVAAPTATRKVSPNNNMSEASSSSSVFKKPALPPRRPVISDTARRCINNVKQQGLPSAAESAFYGNRSRLKPSSSASNGLYKSPSTSRLSSSSHTSHRLSKKTTSTTNLRWI